jgi:hypothetical protein
MAIGRVIRSRRWSQMGRGLLKIDRITGRIMEMTGQA